MMQSYRDVAQKHGVSHVTVRNVVCQEHELYDRLTLYDKEKIEDLQKYIDEKRDTVAALIDLFLFELANPEKIANAPLNQIAQALGTVVDKFTKQKVGVSLENCGVVVLPEQAELKPESEEEDGQGKVQ